MINSLSVWQNYKWNVVNFRRNNTFIGVTLSCFHYCLVPNIICSPTAPLILLLEKEAPSVSIPPLPRVSLHANVFSMTPCESHVTCVTCAASVGQAHVCVSSGKSDLFEQIMKLGTLKRTMWSFLVRKRVWNTICSLNGARQRVRGSSCITTATLLQQTTVGVCHQFPVAALCKSCMIFLRHVTQSRLMISEFRTTSEIRLIVKPSKSQIF